MFTIRLSKIKAVMEEGRFSFICNAIAYEMQRLGLSTDVYEVTHDLRSQLFWLFPAEMKPVRQGCTSTMDTWVSVENSEKFFGYTGGEPPSCRPTSSLREYRMNFIDNLIERYGDIPLMFDEHLTPLPSVGA